MVPDSSFLVSLSLISSHQTAGAAEGHTNAMTTAKRRERGSRRECKRPRRQLQVQMREWDGTIKADHGAVSSSPSQLIQL